MGRTPNAEFVLRAFAACGVLLALSLNTWLILPAAILAGVELAFRTILFEVLKKRHGQEQGTPRPRRGDSRPSGRTLSMDAIKYLVVGLASLAIAFGSLLLMREFTAFYIAEVLTLSLDSNYRGYLTYDRLEGEWTHAQQVSLEIPDPGARVAWNPRLARRQVMKTMTGLGWTYAGDLNGHPLFERTVYERGPGLWPLRKTQAFSMNLPATFDLTRALDDPTPDLFDRRRRSPDLIEGVIEFSASEVTVVAPKHVVVRTSPQSTPHDLLNGHERHAIQVKPDDVIRLEVLGPILQNPLGSRLAAAARSGWVWPTVILLLLVLLSELRKVVAEAFLLPILRRIFQPTRESNSPTSQASSPKDGSDAPTASQAGGTSTSRNTNSAPPQRRGPTSEPSATEPESKSPKPDSPETS